jgi:hypothetical protein
MQDSASILLYSHDSLLLLTRRVMLEKSGYVVFMACNLNEIHGACSTQSIDLIILCQTISSDEAAMALAVVLAFNAATHTLALNEALPEFVERNYTVSTNAQGNRFVSAQAFLDNVHDAIHRKRQFKS